MVQGSGKVGAQIQQSARTNTLMNELFYAITATLRAQQRPTLPPPGWYPDPTGASQMRYWDGSQWNLTAEPPAQ
jgi:hypothetical protein